MLNAKDPATFMTAYAGAMLSRMDFTPDETNVAGYINEGFADFFASQVAGGTIYFDSPGDMQAWGSHSLNVCTDQLHSCLEDNIGRSELRYGEQLAFDDQVARVASTLHDAFDSWQPGGGKPTANLPGNGAAWKLTGDSMDPFISNPTPPFDSGDEIIRLPGRDINSLIRRVTVGDGLSNESIMGGLAGLAEDNGFSWCERCQLFATNEKNFAVDVQGNRQPYSAAQMEARCKNLPIRDWLGPKPASDLPCDTVSIAGRVFRATAPVAAVSVTLSLDGVLVAQAGTNAVGAFRFDGLVAGKTYQLRATHPLGNITYQDSKLARAVAGQVTNVTLVLTARGGSGGGGGDDDDWDCYVGGQRGWYCDCAGICVKSQTTCRHICDD
jgi:hypothetical protein